MQSDTPVDIAIGDLPACRGSEVLLRQVWMNLLSNAVKFSRHQGTPKIVIDSDNRNGRCDTPSATTVSGST